MMSKTSNDSKQFFLVQKSLALRAKYRISELTRVAPIHIGFHPANRNGEPPSADRCVALLNDLLGQGFDPSEANCNGVLVQEKPGSTSIHDFNVQACDGNERMIAFVGGISMTYGSLSHSHLNQVFKNILGKLPLGAAKITAPGTGRVCPQMLAEHDAPFAAACKDGLLWDILSYKILDEDPEGLNIIQAACNCKNAIAMIPHEMEAIACLSRLCNASSAVAENLVFQTVKDKIAETLPVMTQDPDFIHMFRFVVDLGGDGAQFIPDLRDFTAKFLNPQARHQICKCVINLRVAFLICLSNKEGVV